MNDLNKNNSNNLLTIRLFVAFAILAFFVLLALYGFYMYKNSNNITGNPTNWSEFGGYIGGISSALTLWATIYIAYLIEKNTSVRHSNEIKLQGLIHNEELKHQTLLFKNELRAKAYEKIAVELELRNVLFLNDESPNRTVYFLEMMNTNLQTFRNRNLNLLPFLNSDNSVQEISNAIRSLQEYFRMNWPNNSDNMQSYTSVFTFAESDFLSKIERTFLQQEQS